MEDPKKANSINNINGSNEKMRGALAGLTETMKSMNYTGINGSNEKMRGALAGLTETMKSMNYTGIYGSNEKMRGALAGLTETMKSMNYTEIYGSNEKMRGALAGLTETMKSMNYTEIYGSNEKMRGALAGLTETMKSMNYTGIYGSNEKMRGALAGLTETMKSMNYTGMYGSNEKMRGALAGLTETMKSMNYTGMYGLFDTLNKINIDEIVAYKGQFYKDNVNINEDGTISVDGSKVAIEEIKLTINNCLEESGILSQLSTIEDGINNLITQVNKSDKPIVQQILFNLICSLIFFLAMPFINNSLSYVAGDLYKNKPQVIKVIKNEVKYYIINNSNNTSIDDSYEARKKLFNQYRLVIADCLNVRSNHSISSSIVAKLTFGQVVEVIYKNKNWTLVEYKNEDDEICIRGWVFTRYIKRFD